MARVILPNAAGVQGAVVHVRCSLGIDPAYTLDSDSALGTGPLEDPTARHRHTRRATRTEHGGARRNPLAPSRINRTRSNAVCRPWSDYSSIPCRTATAGRTSRFAAGDGTRASSEQGTANAAQVLARHGTARHGHLRSRSYEKAPCDGPQGTRPPSRGPPSNPFLDGLTVGPGTGKWRSACHHRGARGPQGDSTPAAAPPLEAPTMVSEGGTGSNSLPASIIVNCAPRRFSPSFLPPPSQQPCHSDAAKRTRSGTRTTSVLRSSAAAPRAPRAAVLQTPTRTLPRHQAMIPMRADQQTHL